MVRSLIDFHRGLMLARILALLDHVSRISSRCMSLNRTVPTIFVTIIFSIFFLILPLFNAANSHKIVLILVWDHNLLACYRKRAASVS